MPRISRLSRTIALIAATALLVAGCASGTPGTDEPSGDTKKIVCLCASEQDPYVARMFETMTETAEKNGFELTILQSNRDSALQHDQVQQVLASPDKPAAWIWWPADEAAGLSDLRALQKTGIPVIQANLAPAEEASQYVTLYAGSSFAAAGTSAGEALVTARSQLSDAGATFHSPEGNLLTIAWPESLLVTQQKSDALDAALAADPFNDLGVEYAATTDQDGGYATMSTALQKYTEGIDFVVAFNDALAQGAIEAIKQAGLTPGEDIYVLGANCYGLFDYLLNGEQYGSVYVGAELEGVFLMDVIQQYFDAGETVKDGEYYATPDGDGPQLTGEPSKLNFMPTPPVTLGSSDPAQNEAGLEESVVWGVPFTQGCKY